MFYGSQTGTAEEFAGRLAKEGMRYKMKGMVADPEECDMVCTILSLPVNIASKTRRSIPNWHSKVNGNNSFFLRYLLILLKTHA